MGSVAKGERCARALLEMSIAFVVTLEDACTACNAHGYRTTSNLLHLSLIQVGTTCNNDRGIELVVRLGREKFSRKKMCFSFFLLIFCAYNNKLNIHNLVSQTIDS